jgi:acyl-CoA reductase-like NAD-dependent aldehyde dehydrogenase
MQAETGTHWIAGRWTPSHDGALAYSIDPATGATVGRFADGGRAEAQDAIAAARRAFDDPAWSQNPRLRQDVLLAWAARLEARREDLARLMTLENGKAISQSRGEIGGAISEIR